MKKVYQKKCDYVNGDCMQAVFASLLDLPLHYVPKFIELDKRWHGVMRWFMREQGYHFNKTIWNKTLSLIEHPRDNCFKKDTGWHMPSIITPRKLYAEEGINGLFYAAVFSPHHFKWDGNRKSHAVIIDKDYNIIHDPNPNYKGILSYPLAEIIGYNGVIDVEIYNPI